MDNRKLAFAKAINKPLGIHVQDDCTNYGITFGCDINCPVLRLGNCELKDDENKELYDSLLNIENE